MTIGWLLTLPVGFVALMLFLAWASHTGRLPRWSESTHRWSQRHPILAFSPIVAVFLANAVIHFVQGTIWLAALWGVTTILWAFFLGWSLKRSNSSTRREDRDSPL